MKRLLILGGGTAGTMVANRVLRGIDPKEWSITVVDQEPYHYYQPGFLFLPFGLYSENDVVKPRRRYIASGVDYVESRVERVDAAARRVFLSPEGSLDYDLLVVATGSRPAPELTEGLLGADWRKRVFDFYTFEGALALRKALADWKGGRLVVHVCEFPIKCPVAPLEFAFLADWWLAGRGLREKTELVFVTPLSGAFTKPRASQVLGRLIEEKGIRLVSDFAVARVDNEAHTLVSWDEKRVPYDLLVTVPPNTGDPLLERSGLGDELNFVPTDPHTLQAKGREDIFVVGDATDIPASKAGSVAHFESEGLARNILRRMQGLPLEKEFDGHANCFIESGYGKAFLIDFNYEQEPVPGRFPFGALGPLPLLRESRLNHLGKLAFRWLYWNVLLRALPTPGVGARMSLKGKEVDSHAQ